MDRIFSSTQGIEEMAGESRLAGKHSPTQPDSGGRICPPEPMVFPFYGKPEVKTRAEDT